MRSRYPLLWLKKRGKRRTGSPRWGQTGELLYHSVFVVVGFVACTWHVANVLIPDVRQRGEVASFEQTECLVEASRVEKRGDRYAPVWTVRLAGDDGPSAAPKSVAAKPVDDRRVAQRALGRFPVGWQAVYCVDPADAGHVVLSRGFRWWPWAMLLIPLSMVIIGVVGMLRTVLKAGASVERRHTVAQHANAFNPFSSSRVSVAVPTGLPSTHDVDDSPGVKLRYRLPIQGAAGWRLVGMTVMCVAWNLLVGFFLIGVISDHLAGRPNWAVTIVVAPLACGGGWLAYSLIRESWSATGIGVTQVEIASHPLIPGQTGGGVVLQAGQFRARWLTVALVCEEIATYCEGTDTRTSIEEVYREELHRERRFRIEMDRPFEQAFTFTVPAGAMHSFVSPHNEVRWSVEVKAAPMRWPVFTRRFRICVYPTSWRPPGYTEYPQLASAGAPT